MAVADTDLKLKFSVVAAAGNTTPGTPAGSLGDQISTTEVTNNTMYNLFDVVSAAEASAGDVEYRCVFVHNAHASQTAYGLVVSIPSQTVGGADAAIGLDTTAASAVGSGSAQALTVVDENTVPSGVSFGTGNLTIGDLAAGQVKAFWIRRTVAAGTSAISPDGMQIRVAGETDA